MSQQEAARVFGISRRAVGVWVRAHRASGPAALNPQRRGRSPGEQFALSRVQQVELLAEISRHTPDELGLAAPVWSRRVVTEFIAGRFDLSLSTTTVGHYLLRWGVLDPTRRVAAGNWMHLSWRRPVPRFVGTALIPAPGYLDVLVAQSPGGASYFLCLQRPYGVPAVQDFATRLEGALGRPVSLSPGAWPADAAAVLRAWRVGQSTRAASG